MSTQIPTLPDRPAPTDSVDDFDVKAFAFNAALNPWGDAVNALGQEMQINADVAAALILAMALPQFAGTSSTPLTIGTGTKSFTTQTGKGWIAGQIVVASNGGAYMKGTVAAYNSGTGALDLTVSTTNGSGSFSSWTLGLSYDGLALAKSGAITSSGLTQATARMLGRSTAGTGAVEEISLGGGLSLAAGVLSVPNAGITPAMLSRPYTVENAVTVSGSPTAVDFSPPSWATEIEIDVYRLSGSGSSPLTARLGTGGVAKTSGYSGATTLASSGTSPTVSALSTGFSLISVTGGGDTFSGTFSFKLVDPSTNTWLCKASFGMINTVREQRITGDVSLSGALNLIRITTEGGTDTIDNGVVLRMSYRG